MHTKYEGKEEGVITMVCIVGLFILGKLVGGNKLTDPRIFSIIEEGRRIQMSPPPGTPPFIVLTGVDGFRYTMPETPENKNILELYDRVTHPPNVVIPTSRPTLVTADITGKLN